MQQSLQQSRLCDSPPSTSCSIPAAPVFRQHSDRRSQKSNARSGRSELVCNASSVAAAENGTLQKASRIPPLPFVKVAGQEEMKLALLLNVVDPRIGGVLIMGDRGTGKSVAVSCHVECLSICCKSSLCCSTSPSFSLSLMKQPEAEPLR